MLWQYTRRDTKVLLLAVLATFSAYGFLVGEGWRTASSGMHLTANTVAVMAGVEENRTNTLLAELNARERALAAREAAAGAGLRSDDGILLVVTLIGTSLLGLILLNFYLDSRRRFTFK